MADNDYNYYCEDKNEYGLERDLHDVRLLKEARRVLKFSHH
jgi:hypothetical protein